MIPNFYRKLLYSAEAIQNGGEFFFIGSFFLVALGYFVGNHAY